MAQPPIYKAEPVPLPPPAPPSSSFSPPMRTKQAIPHPNPDTKLGPNSDDDDDHHHPKRQKFDKDSPPNLDLFDGLPDDLVLSVLSLLSASADSSSDLVRISLTCKRLNTLGSHPAVLSKASRKSLAIRAKNWSESGHRFLQRCSDAGNLEAMYTLGMIRFYCLEMRRSGARLMARAAIRSHALALYSLAVIHFNGSGGDKTAKNLRAGFALCARAAILGHVDAIREAGHCLTDGYGVAKSVERGRKLMVLANVRELNGLGFPFGSGSSKLDPKKLLSDFGWWVSDPHRHPVHRFLVEWFASRFGSGEGQAELTPCSYKECGRRESRRLEFRRCAVCETVSYCSRVCQAKDWRGAHKDACVDRRAPVAAGEN